jgi:hypothetical protein
MTDQAGHVRVEVLLAPADAQRVDEWRVRNHLPSREEAVRRLLELGLAAARQDAAVSQSQPQQGHRMIGPEDEDRAGPEAPDTARRTQSP